MKRWAGILAVTISMAMVIVFWLSRPLFSQQVYQGVAVANIEVGGKTREEVVQLLTAWQKDQKARPILLSYEDRAYRVEPENLNYCIDVEATTDAVWQFGRDDSWWTRIKNIRSAEKEGWSIPLKIKYNENKLDSIIEQLRESVSRPPCNATVSLLSGRVIPEQEGRELNAGELKELIVLALNRSDSATIPLPVTAIHPEITANALAESGIKELVAVYTTQFNAEDVNRTANVKLSAQKITGKLLYPGQTFSYNDTVGPREKSQGFKEAMEIINGEFVPGVGGGVCQVSSTLYNTVLLAGLTVVERTNHSKPLAYVPLGRDATVVYDVLDLKFINSSQAPIMIMAEIIDNKLHVGIFGQRVLEKNIDIITTEQQVIQPAIIKKTDAALAPGENKVEKPGKPGYEVTVVRIIRNDSGKELRREVISHDKYAPDNTVIRVGPEVRPVESRKMPRRR
ncbi:MAG: VanW like protein [Firmicutes bacterium]|nr:VanW like protein [Bacillota bacterium]